MMSMTVSDRILHHKTNHGEFFFSLLYHLHSKLQLPNGYYTMYYHVAYELISIIMVNDDIIMLNIWVTHFLSAFRNCIDFLGNL